MKPGHRWLSVYWGSISLAPFAKAVWQIFTLLVATVSVRQKWRSSFGGAHSDLKLQSSCLCHLNAEILRWVPLCPDLINKASSWGPEPCVKVNKGELELPRGFLIVMKTQIKYSPPPFPWHWRGNMKRQKSQIVELKAGALNRIFKSYRKWIYPTLPRQVEKEKKMKKVWCIIMHWKFSQEMCTSKSASQNSQILCACSISFTDTNTEDTFFILICGTCECVLHRL